MKGIGLIPAVLLLSASAAAASTSAAVNWTATLTFQTTGGPTGAILSGNTTLSPLGSGTITATLVSLGDPTIPIPYTVSLSGGGTLSGILSLPMNAINNGGPIAASANVSGGTGQYAGYGGSFPSLTGTSSGSTGTSLVGVTISFSGTGALSMGGTPLPIISDVTDAGSYNFTQIAQGSIFVVKGAGLSNPGLFHEAFPLPTTSANSAAGGVSITFTPQSGTPQSSGTGTKAYLIYEDNDGAVNQLAAVAPSTLAPGIYNVTVTSNGVASPSFQTTVAAAKPELFTVDSTGLGMAQAQNYISSSELDLNRFTTGTAGGSTISPAHPGQTLILYATGLGPISSPDNVAASNSFGSSVQVLVNGVPITPAYAGRAPGFSGLDQINVTLPAGVETSCVVPVQIQENGLLSAANFISIAPTGSNACSYTGFTSSQLQNLDNGELLYAGDFYLSENQSGAAQPQFQTGGAFFQYSGAELPSIPIIPATTTPPQPNCTVQQIQLPPQSPFAVSSSLKLDAGAVTLNGPTGSGAANEALAEANNTYAGTITAIPPGTWTLSGSGGASVEPFTASLTTGAPFTVTGGLPANIVRANGFTIQWTGGNPDDLVSVSGLTETLANGLPTGGAVFVCLTGAGAGSLTVPASITNQLTAVSAQDQTAKTGYSSLTVTTKPPATIFAAPLVKGGAISNASFSVTISMGGTPEYQ